MCLLGFLGQNLRTCLVVWGCDDPIPGSCQTILSLTRSLGLASLWIPKFGAFFPSQKICKIPLHQPIPWFWMHLKSAFDFLLYAKHSTLQLHLYILLNEATPINLLTIVQHPSRRKTVVHLSIIWSPSPSWSADRPQDVHLFFWARRVWTFHCILIHVSPFLLSHYLSNMNFVSKGSFSFYSNVNILLAIFLSSHIISSPKILYKMAFWLPLFVL